MELEIPNTAAETWHVEANGEVFETNLDEMANWIAEGSLLRIDRVRKGNLRWIEAGKVPALTGFFNAKDAAEPPKPVITTTHTEILGVAPAPASTDAGFGVVNTTFGGAGPANGQNGTSAVCAVHGDAPAAYVCETCDNHFCRACPNSYGGTVKICPFCGAMCSSIEKIAAARTVSERRNNAAQEAFGFGDFAKALAHPVRFKFSLIVGAVMFAVFSLGQLAVGFGSIFLAAAALISFMLANMLWFGVLATTVDNFVQGKFDADFMPSFEDFNIWDDVVHPFFLSLGAYVSSFGPFVIVMAVAIFFVLGAVRGEINEAQNTPFAAANTQLPMAESAARQSRTVRELVNRANDAQRRRIEAIESGNDAEIEANQPPQAFDEEQHFEQLSEMINQQRKAQLESAIGKTSETRQAEQQAFIQRILGYGVIFVLLGGVTLLWGFFYFPAACAVAGYTRSFAAAVNPLVGLDTIRRLGGSYALILLMGFLLMMMSGVVSGVFELVFSPFDLPAMGNIPAKFLASMFGFYLSVVFSCILGYALSKKADKLDLAT
ncbi:MAG: hypothetical protein IPM59_11055 [Chloracidobacterium sp.]|nr:hypothetical protein [Chloracidobacterium sp.]